VHLRDLFDASYPWRELFALLAAQHYEGFTLAEIPEKYGSGESLALLQSPVAELSTWRGESLSPQSPLSGC
jgi:hypothetical protein